jgi:hypothetical protein
MHIILSKTTRGYMRVSSFEVEGCDGNVNSLTFDVPRVSSF